MKGEFKTLEVCLPTEPAVAGANRTKWEALRFIARIIHWKRALVYGTEPEMQLCTFIYHMNNIQL